LDPKTVLIGDESFSMTVPLDAFSFMEFPLAKIRLALQDKEDEKEGTE
jgi:hypothetical protein